VGWIAWTAAVAGALALVALILITALGRSGVRAGRVGRMAQLSRLAAGFSASWLGARLRRLFARGERRQRIDDAARQRNARRLAETMGDMKGAFMKLGQMMSFVTDAIPAEYREMLAKLQADAPPLDFPSIRDVLETELDAPLERTFAGFDEEPLAAASIGQVHRATLPDGREVAVKVQYPGIATAIAGDLANAGVLYRLMGLMYPSLDPVPIVEELRARISEELDYELEARHQSAFAELYRGHPYIRIPEVVADYSTARVLTSELVSGDSFATAETASEEDRNRYSEVLYRFVFGSSLRFRVFNGDPHPGNYKFHPGGAITNKLLSLN
jgi:predicted unusual protein kinase regulating ubiquinone biosynthesis (AarF/ABC1/UbiB family)